MLAKYVSLEYFLANKWYKVDFFLCNCCVLFNKYDYLNFLFFSFIEDIEEQEQDWVKKNLKCLDVYLICTKKGNLGHHDIMLYRTILRKFLIQNVGDLEVVDNKT